MKLVIAAFAFVVTLSPATALAALFFEDFSSDPTANWVTNSGPGINVADFYFDYSTVGIPQAPSGGNSRGLKLQANLNPNIPGGLTGSPIPSSPNGTYAPGGTFGGITVSPSGLNLSGNYVLRFDWWANYQGPVNGGGNGTTQVSQFGIGTAGTTSQWIGAVDKESVFFAATLDGGSAADFRAYSSAAPTSYAAGSPVYAAPDGGINNTNPYYHTPFPGGVSAPPGQVAIFPLQTGQTAAGVPAFQWNLVEIHVHEGVATWMINGTLLATIDLTTTSLGGGGILFGHSDTNTGASIDETHPWLLFTLIDNIVVVRDGIAVSEPQTGGLILLGLAGFVGRRLRTHAARKLA